MAKSINSNNKNEDDELRAAELTAVTEEEAGVEFDEIVGIHRGEDRTVKASKRPSVRGKSLPVLKRTRDTSNDKQPLMPAQMGLSEEDSFLTSRKVTPIDLRRHQEVHKKDLLGTNFRKPRDFMRMFDKGPSTKQQPKLDLSYSIEANPELKRELIVEQVLRNLHSAIRGERVLAEKILIEMGTDKEQMEDFKDDPKANQNREFIEKISGEVPSDSI
jgi:hypothetical protein